MLKAVTNLIAGLSQPLKNYLLLEWVKIKDNEYVVTKKGGRAFRRVGFGIVPFKTLEEYAEAEVKRLKAEEKKSSK